MRAERGFQVAFIGAAHGVARSGSHGEVEAGGHAERPEPVVVVHDRWGRSLHDAHQAHQLAQVRVGEEGLLVVERLAILDQLVGADGGDVGVVVPMVRAAVPPQEVEVLLVVASTAGQGLVRGEGGRGGGYVSVGQVGVDGAAAGEGAAARVVFLEEVLARAFAVVGAVAE